MGKGIKMSKPHGNKGHQRAMRGDKPLGVVIGIRSELEFREGVRQAACAASMTVSEWCLIALREKLQRDKGGA